MDFFWHSRGADWEWEDGATRCERDGAGRVCVSLFHLLTPHHAPTFADFLVYSHIPMKSFHSLAPLLSFVLYVTTSECRRERRLSPCDRNSFLMFLYSHSEIVVLGDHGNRPVRMRKERFRRDLRIFGKI